MQKEGIARNPAVVIQNCPSKIPKHQCKSASTQEINARPSEDTESKRGQVRYVSGRPPGSHKSIHNIDMQFQCCKEDRIYIQNKEPIMGARFAANSLVLSIMGPLSLVIVPRIVEDAS